MGLPYSAARRHAPDNPTTRRLPACSDGALATLFQVTASVGLWLGRRKHRAPISKRNWSAGEYHYNLSVPLGAHQIGEEYARS
jgi:hypothetical protein